MIVKAEAPKAPIEVKAEANKENSQSPTIKDLVVWISDSEKYAKTLGKSPRKITNALNLMGIECSYDTVKKAIPREKR